jgi:hypothetical protein
MKNTGMTKIKVNEPKIASLRRAIPLTLIIGNTVTT